MPYIETILTVKALNLDKLPEKIEPLLKALFAPSIEELGGLLADQIRGMRQCNQIKILSKVNEKLQQNKIEPQKVSLKVLAPLVDYSSLEEEENLQDKWSNLIAHILGGDKEVVFQQNCITILNKLSSEEAKLLDKLHDILLDRLDKRRTLHQGKRILVPDKRPIEFRLNSFTFNIAQLSKEIHIPISELEFSISNLISLGLLKWETDVEVIATKSSEDPEDTDIDVDVNVDNNNNFIFTSIGDKFIKICKE